MPNFKQTCQEFFGTTDFYEVLGVEKTATEKQIKKAYHRLSLTVHPDRASDANKERATEKFKVLGRIHSILQDKDKRKIYDDCGDFDEESDNSFNWMEYWRSIFKKIDIKDIEDYEKSYVGSETELRDIKKAYTGTKGNMDLMLEIIPFSSCDTEPRIIEIVRKMVDDGEVEEYEGFFNEPKAKKRRRRTKWEAEKEEVAKIDMSALEKEIEMRQEERFKRFSNLISDIESKYGGQSKRKALTVGTGPKGSGTKRKRAGKSSK